MNIFAGTTFGKKLDERFISISIGGLKFTQEE
jgi:hypothetical protein